MSLDTFLSGFVQTTDFPTLDAMYFIMEKLNNPHKKLKFIHIAGTNGKGSIVETLNQILLLSRNYTVGKFLSPHLCTSNESICINNKMISEKEVDNYIPIFEKISDEYFQKTGRNVTRFEILTSMAILYFYEQKCDIVLLEVGLGGMYDCTNIVQPIVSAFGSISYDHTAILGNTLKEIAEQKAGIIKQNSHTVIFEQDALPFIEEKCKKENNKLIAISKNAISNYHYDNNFQYFTYKNTEYTINLKGKKQIENACVVLEILKILENYDFSISNEVIFDGLKSVVHHARFEVLNTNPIIIFDGAHNENAMKNLIETIKTSYPHTKKTFIVSILQTKDYKKLLTLLLENFNNCEFIFTSGANDEHKFFSSNTLYNYASSVNSNNILLEKDFCETLNSIKKDTLSSYFIIGSFYNYKEASNIIQKKF